MGAAPSTFSCGDTGSLPRATPTPTRAGQSHFPGTGSTTHSRPNLCPLQGGPRELLKGQELALGLSDSLPRLSVTLKMAFEAAQLLPKEPAVLSTQDGADACLSLDTIHAPAGTVCVDRGSQGDEHTVQRPRHTAGGCCHCPADTEHKTGTAGTAEQSPRTRTQGWAGTTYGLRARRGLSPPRLHRRRHPPAPGSHESPSLASPTPLPAPSPLPRGTRPPAAHRLLAVTPTCGRGGEWKAGSGRYSCCRYPG